ncbi:MAG: hypothetical protein SGJ18_01000 [Pseudomonadota bacterium]|nr:hypothetical protein [Pseudomonadota bacterium]
MKAVGLFISVIFTASTVFANDLESKYPNDKGVYVVKGETQKRVINSILEEVDVAFEMGDGYFDVESIKLFIVRNKTKVLGYLNEVKLRYTEDPEYVFVLVRYDENGSRVGEIEELRREPLQ